MYVCMRVSVSVCVSLFVSQCVCLCVILCVDQIDNRLSGWILPHSVIRRPLLLGLCANICWFVCVLSSAVPGRAEEDEC